MAVGMICCVAIAFTGISICKSSSPLMTNQQRQNTIRVPKSTFTMLVTLCVPV